MRSLSTDLSAVRFQDLRGPSGSLLIRFPSTSTAKSLVQTRVHALIVRLTVHLLTLMTLMGMWCLIEFVLVSSLHEWPFRG
mmetsp:Transcript_52047/g.130758  ORF Transcript_52047/g.130758 Transcript_52047/m.130758 type:complete len:81 (-) Transcript_52047:837-1079(-)